MSDTDRGSRHHPTIGRVGRVVDEIDGVVDVVTVVAVVLAVSPDFDSGAGGGIVVLGGGGTVRGTGVGGLDTGGAGFGAGLRFPLARLATVTGAIGFPESLAFPNSRSSIG